MRGGAGVAAQGRCAVSFRVFKAPDQLDSEKSGAAEDAVPAVVQLDSLAGRGFLRWLGEFVLRIRILARGRGLSLQQRLNTYR